ncbi:hypothetical protein [Branchiibius cervicis]|uniref:Plasmid mobilization relaxosome protein MobC n=1 Tax=Branchiibius cervicis TaxID=908252 RepID=A0ABW2AWR0_9MICO
MGRDGLYRRRRTDGRRPHRVEIRHSAEEYARVAAMASYLGISIPRLYEQSLFAGDAAAAARLTTVLTELRTALRLTANGANNLNQIARTANAVGDISAPQTQAAARLMQLQGERIEALVNSLPVGFAFDIDNGASS